MKKLLVTFLFFAVAFSVKAQLANTKWTGTMHIPDPTPVTLNFKTDSVEMIINENGYIGETMNYTIKGDVITMKKLSGNSPCDNQPFTANYSIKDGRLFIKPLKDPCEERANAWDTSGYGKVK